MQKNTKIISKNLITNFDVSWKRDKHPAIMRHLELNIEKIKRVSKKREKENNDFRTFLKGVDSDKVDIVVHKLNEEIVSQIDCQECGNCCESLRPCVTDSEIENLSQLNKSSKKDFILKYVEKDDFDDIKYLKIIHS